MGLNRLLGCVVVFSGFLIWKCVSGQSCTSITNITSSSQPRLVNTTGVLCVQCLNSGGVSPTDTLFLDNAGMTIANSPDFSVTDGVLMILNASAVIPDGDDGVQFDCQSGNTFRHANFELFSNNLLPPILSEASITLNEGDSTLQNVICNSPNAGLLNVMEQWFNPMMMPAEGASFGLLGFTDIQRSQAGDYTCRLTAFTGQTTSVTLPVIVQYAPEATTPEVEVSRQINLGGDMMLTCDFDGVPTPSVTWVQNSTVKLDVNDPRITVTSESGASAFVTTLRITGLDRDGGGFYSCSFNNSVGDIAVMVTEVLILIPPAPVTDLANTTYEEELITVTWMKGFNGFTPITGATIEYMTDGGNTTTQNVSSTDPTTVTLSNLTPFTNYTISVSLFNAVGTGDPTTIQVQTRSRQLDAPVDVVITPVSSTVLNISWNPPDNDPGTDSSDNWFVELSLQGRVNDTDTTPDAETTTVTFSDLNKGTEYSVRVHGVNEVGPGVFSDAVSMETSVDPPSAPQGVTLTGATSFALKATWEPPADDGGRPIASYNVEVESLTFTQSASDPRMLLIISEAVLMEDTTYTVRITANNTSPLTGPEATADGTTLSIDEPQSILIPPMPEDIRNTSITVSWEDPGGNVDAYIVQFTQDAPPNTVTNVTVNGNFTSTQLTGLEPDTSYSVVVFSMNSNGVSIIASPLARFTTMRPFPPQVSLSPDGVIMVGDTITLTCVTTDTRPIMWFERDRNISLVPPVFEKDGTSSRSTLTINNIQTVHTGVYVCKVRQETSPFVVTVETISITPSLPPVITTESGGISDAVIIGAAAGGGGALLLILIVGFVLVLCFCCRPKQKDQYITNKAMKPDKRTKELFEVSTSYAPVRQSTDGNETGISFNMPEDYQAHSSFNTLDKVEKPKRSSSPEAPNISSFGVAAPSSSTDNLTAGTGSPPRYQDMPPISNDGTLL